MKSRYWAVTGLPMLGALGCCVLFVCCEPKPPPRGPAAQSAHGTISGQIVFRGHVPTSKTWDVSDPLCPPERKEEGQVTVGATGGVKDAIVRILGLGSVAQTTVDPVTIEYRSCLQQPRVIVLGRNQPLVVRSVDRTLHNARVRGETEVYFNKALTKDTEFAETFQTARAGDVLEVHCDLHPWETAHILIADEASAMNAATTSVDGEYRLSDVPFGEYTIEVWHPALGVKREAIRVERTSITLPPIVFREGDPALTHPLK